MDNEQIKADFTAPYQAMNGMTLKETDRVIYPVCTLCRDHEKAGFILISMATGSSTASGASAGAAFSSSWAVDFEHKA